MALGNITRPGISVPFVCAQTPAGMIDDRPVTQAEELTTPGVDGRRWRNIFEQYPSFQMTTYSEATNFADGINMKRSVERNMVQKLVTVRTEIAGNSYALKCHVSAAAIIVHPGPMTGAGVGAGTAHVEITWQMEGTDFDL